MPIRNPFAPSAALLRLLDSQSERERLASALDMPVSRISEFANGQVCFTLNEFISILDIAGIELIDSSELDSIKHFAMKYLRERLESRRS